MRYYPLFLDLRGRSCLVVGGGKVAERKIRTLLDCGAEVKIVAKDRTTWIESEIEAGRLRFLGKEFSPEQIDGARLVIAATSDSELNRKIAREAEKRGVWCNVVDQPEDCTFILPSIVVRGDLVIAISTSGKSPALARKIREDLEKRFGREYSTFTEILGSVRKKVLDSFSDGQQRKKIFTSLVESNMVELIRNKNWVKINSLLCSILGKEITLNELGFRGEIENGQQSKL